MLVAQGQTEPKSWLIIGIVNVYCTLITPIIEYVSVVFSNLPTYLQGSPKCGIVGGDKTEVEGEIGASREDPEACSPGKILKIYNT